MKPSETRIRELVREEIEIVPYNPRWPVMFENEKNRLLEILPGDLMGRIEHFGSTAVPGLSAKPVIDMLVEVTSLEMTRIRIVPILVNQGYEYLWRPTQGDDVPPFYAWFIKRDREGRRTHHIHMVEREFPHWERLLFRDYLIGHPDIASEYQALKLKLAGDFPRDRIAYTEEKTGFILKITALAKEMKARS